MNLNQVTVPATDLEKSISFYQANQLSVNQLSVNQLSVVDCAFKHADGCGTRSKSGQQAYGPLYD